MERTQSIVNTFLEELSLENIPPGRNGEENGQESDGLLPLVSIRKRGPASWTESQEGSVCAVSLREGTLLPFPRLCRVQRQGSGPLSANTAKGFPEPEQDSRSREQLSSIRLDG